METQQELLKPMPAMGLHEGDQSIGLGVLIDLWEKHFLELAPFQRDDNAWDDKKAFKWAQTISTGTKIWGTFCIYRLLYNGKPDGVLYLADGYQRLSQTLKIIANPEKYNIKMSGEDLRSSLALFMVTVQFAVFTTHGPGKDRFQQVNLGTVLEPTEYHKGELTQLTNVDGNKLISRIIEIVSKCEIRVGVRSAQVGRTKKLRYNRGAYALFYQYVSNYQGADFWKYASLKILTGKPAVERLLYEFLVDKKVDEIDKMLRDFENYLNIICATIESHRFSTLGQHEILIPQTVFRALLHMGIYKRNTSWHTRHFEEAVDLVFEASKGHPGKLVLNEVDFSENIGMQDLGKIFRACKFRGIPTRNESRKQKVQLKKGYHHSHALPFAEFGEGDTFIEPAMPNQSRGAVPIDLE